MLAFLFLLYETAGIFANLGGGWLATRFGIPRMLMTGLTLQITSLLLLSMLNPTWSAAFSVAWVVTAQGIAGVAKDLTKTASKSAIKATSEGGSGQLFRWVAWFTGSKNAMKGVGFFCGGLLLAILGFQGALWLMAGVLACILAGVALSLPQTLGKAKASESFREQFAKSPAINLMAAARIFLFGSRDVWFVVGLPVFLYSQGWRYLEVAGFIASWTIGYGIVQAIAPSVIRRSAGGLSREVPEARLWGAVLTALPLVLAHVLSNAHLARPDLVITIGLSVFGFVFAVISSLHSYLILAYAGSEKAAEDVGFYYAANAGGAVDRDFAVGHPRPSGRDGRVFVGFGGNTRPLPRGHLSAADYRCSLATGSSLTRCWRLAFFLSDWPWSKNVSFEKRTGSVFPKLRGSCDVPPFLSSFSKSRSRNACCELQRRVGHQQKKTTFVTFPCAGALYQTNAAES
jgi:MFS transporter, APGE family, 1-arseno-3-phosphoglycerate exporter